METEFTYQAKAASSKFDAQQDGIYLEDHDLEANEHFIKFVFVPYFKDIYNDLAEKSDKKSAGISKIILTDVSLF